VSRARTTSLERSNRLPTDAGGPGLGLDTRDALPAAAGQACGATCLVQRNRPEGIGSLDLVMSEVHGRRCRGRAVLAIVREVPVPPEAQIVAALGAAFAVE